MELNKETILKLNKEINNYFDNIHFNFTQSLNKTINENYILPFVKEIKNSQEEVNNIKKFISGKKSKLFKSKIDYLYEKISQIKPIELNIVNSKQIENFFDCSYEDNNSNVVDTVLLHNILYIAEKMYEDSIPKLINDLWGFLNDIKRKITKENLFLWLNIDNNFFKVKKVKQDIEDNKKITTLLKLLKDFISFIQNNIYESYFPQPTYSRVESLSLSLASKKNINQCKEVDKTFIKTFLNILENNITEDIQGFIKKRKYDEYHLFDGKAKVVFYDIVLEILNILCNNWKNTKPEAIFIFNEVIKIFNKIL